MVTSSIVVTCVCVCVCVGSVVVQSDRKVLPHLPRTHCRDCVCGIQPSEHIGSYWEYGHYCQAVEHHDRS